MAEDYTLSLIAYRRAFMVILTTMQCGSCSCSCCEHPAHGSQRAFIPYNRPPSPALPANTLLLPSSASAFDAPPHHSTRKRAFSHVTNITSAQLLEALHWQQDAEEEEAASTTTREREEGDAEREAPITPTVEAKGRQASSTPRQLTVTLPSDSSISSIQADRASRPLSPRPLSPRAAFSRPLSPRPLSPSQQTASSQAMAINRLAVPSSAASSAHHLQPPASARSASSRSPVLDSDTAVFHGRRSPTVSSPAAREVNDTAQAAATASLEKRKREAELRWERDRARREVLRAAFETAQQRRLQRVAADDRFYAEMLRRQWERRVMMQHFEARAQQERQRRHRERAGTAAAGAETADQKPAFADYGASSAQRQQDGQRLRTFNISPDVSGTAAHRSRDELCALLWLTAPAAAALCQLYPNHPQEPQSYPTARLAAIRALQQKQLVIDRVQQQMEAAGIAYDPQPSARDRRIAGLMTLSAASSDTKLRPQFARPLSASSASSPSQPKRPSFRSGRTTMRPLVGAGSDPELLDSFSSLRPPPLREAEQPLRR